MPKISIVFGFGVAVNAKNEIFLEKHKNKGYKNYCFDTLYPLEKDKIYYTLYFNGRVIRDNFVILPFK